jgi:hypothetical protein
MRYALRGRKIPSGLLGAFALAFAVEWFVARHEFDLLNRTLSWQWWYHHKLSRSLPDSDIYCFGDSLAKFGMAPAVIQPITARRVYNLALPSGQAPSSYFLLRRVLARGARPSAVVVNFLPSLLRPGPTQNLGQWPSFLTLRECGELAWDARDADLFASVVLAEMLPSLRVKQSVRDNLAAAIRGADLWQEHNVPPHLRRNLKVNRGALVMPGMPFTADLEHQGPENSAPDWSCHPVNERYVRRFLALAAEHRVRVFWVLSPVLPELQERCKRTGFDDRHVRFVRRATAPFENVTVLDGRGCRYDASAFLDPIHLSRRGTAALSTNLAHVLREELAGSGPPARWLELAGFEETAAEVALEDLDQSRQIMSERAARRAR